MADVITEDMINFAAYERETDVSVKVRPASVFRDELLARFQPRPKGARQPRMFSTKLSSVLEFRPGEVTCWAGYSGHRKSMFTGQVALDLCVQNERVLMASFEMQPSATMARMVRQAIGIAQPASPTLDGFSSWTDGRLWIFDHLGRINPSQCLAVLRYFAEELRGTHVFIDSLMMVVASEEHLDEQKQFATDIVRLAQETGMHVHLVAHAKKPAEGREKFPPSKYDVRGSSAITDQAHNVVTVWANKEKKDALQKDPGDEQALCKPDAAVTVEKQRNGDFEGRLQLWFDEGSLRFVNDRFSPIEPYVLEPLPVDRKSTGYQGAL